ncbi:hypothetical protein ACHHYP_16367 [Achlya hypogyna]|uniref:Methyltransferase domain-containing protein n=1 Tax=Achlya hypogyna TaxID=1202772 RepID=A0A1V9Y8W5_ACHHY|nr:hypothetical protein ACHHYP_16367 [Achlya hypogyna]
MVKEVTTLAEWRDSAFSLLDLREEAERSYVFSCDRVVHIPWSAQKARCQEYPTRQVVFALLCSSDRATAAAQVDWFLSEQIRTQQLPWTRLAFYIVDSDAICAEAAALGIVGAALTLFPQPRLWSPNALLYDLVPVVLASSAPANSAVLDLACGSGRDIVYFAEEVLAKGSVPGRPQRFIGVDHNCMGRKKALAFADSRGVGNAFEFVKMDLNATAPLTTYDWGPVHCIYGCRFLNRELFPVIPVLLPVGGLFAWMHFCMPPDGSEWRWPHPTKAADILAVGELRKWFASTFGIIRSFPLPSFSQSLNDTCNFLSH